MPILFLLKVEKHSEIPGTFLMKIFKDFSHILSYKDGFIFGNLRFYIDDFIKIVGEVPVAIKLIEETHGMGAVLAETKKAEKFRFTPSF